MTGLAAPARETRLPQTGACAGVCPIGLHGDCAIAAKPHVSIETGNRILPRVDIHLCDRCGHGISLPPMDDVTPLYAGRESEDYLARDAAWVALLKAHVNRRLARSLLSYVEEPRTVADFGTGNGALASALATELGEAGEVTGLDFFDQPPSGISPAGYASFGSLAASTKTYDLVTCFHVLEHDDDPRRLIAQVVKLAKPGGIVVIEVPNVDCVWNGWFGAACANWYAPFHRVHFSRKSLHALITRSGLEIIETQDICGPTFALSLARLTGGTPGSIYFALGLLLRPVQWIAEKITGRGSALRVVARRI